jgi:hypothetical protein
MGKISLEFKIFMQKRFRQEGKKKHFNIITISLMVKYSVGVYVYEEFQT